ncbi:DUF2961 domain-containing protein [Paenibacillus rhizoplanae]
MTRRKKANYADQKVYELKNLTGDDNYVLMDAVGEGHYVGCNLSIDHLNPMPGFSWPGEGDDMFFIDGEPWPPRLHGTGTEDYFCAAWGYPSGKYDSPYHGISLYAPIRGNGDAWRESNTILFNDYSGKNYTIPFPYCRSDHLPGIPSLQYRTWSRELPVQ